MATHSSILWDVCPRGGTADIKKDIRDFLMVQWIIIHLQCRGHGFDPWSGKIPHAEEQRSPCTTTSELMCCNT